MTNPPPLSGHGDVCADVIRRITGTPFAFLIPGFRRRREVGIARYGVPLQYGNGRDYGLDASEEGYDAVQYLQGGQAPAWLFWLGVVGLGVVEGWRHVFGRGPAVPRSTP